MLIIFTLACCCMHCFCTAHFLSTFAICILLIQILIHTCIFIIHTWLQSFNVVSLCSDPVFLIVKHAPGHRMLYSLFPPPWLCSDTCTLDKFSAFHVLLVQALFSHLLVTGSGCLFLFCYLLWLFGYLFRLFSCPSYLLRLFIFHLLLVQAVYIFTLKG